MGNPASRRDEPRERLAPPPTNAYPGRAASSRRRDSHIYASQPRCRHMRDIFEDIYAAQPLDPMEAARRAVRPNLRKRFYTKASAGEAGEGGHPVLLDGKPVRTPARRLLAAPTLALAQALAEEWNAQAEVIDPARMQLTRLANA